MTKQTQEYIKRFAEAIKYNIGDVELDIADYDRMIHTWLSRYQLMLVKSRVHAWSEPRIPDGPGYLERLQEYVEDDIYWETKWINTDHISHLEYFDSDADNVLFIKMNNGDQFWVNGYKEDYGAYD